MSSDIQLESIRLLGNGVYRIEWLGDIVKSRKSNSTTQCVRVICSEWTPGDGNRSMRARGIEPITVRIPVALMRYLRIGDLWQDGRFVGSTTCEERVYSELAITEETATAQLAGASWRAQSGQTSHQLPFNVVDGHATCTDSWLVRVTVAKDSALLIPALEIARFYFGRSGILLNRLFDSAANSQQKWSRKLERNEATGEVDIELADGVPSMAACDVARLELDPAAQRTVRAIIASAIRAQVNWEPFFPRLMLPYCGHTTLRVGGMSIPSARGEVFLVHYIASCSHPFPFTGLRCHVWSAATDPLETIGQGDAPQALMCDDRLQHPSDGRAADLFPDLQRKVVRRVLHACAAA